MELFSYSNSNNQNQLSNVKPLIESDVCKMDLIVSIGGDGTMLKSSKLASNYDVPITGINKGRLGFLTDINPELVSDALKEIIQAIIKLNPGCFLTSKYQMEMKSASSDMLSMIR